MIENVNKSPTLKKYKDIMKELCHMYMPEKNDGEIDQILDYSINKRYYNYKGSIENSYTNTTHEMTLLAMADYIAKKQPIVTAHGTLFMKHGDVPNPMGLVIQSFIDKRKAEKKKMLSFPKGNEEFEKWNLMQQLSKIDCNG